MRLPPLNKEALQRLKELGEKLMAQYDHGGGCPCGLYKECDPSCREYKNQEEKKEWYGGPDGAEKLLKAIKAKTDKSVFDIVKEVKTRCNCDASCGENRSHNVGDSECRFRSEEEYDAFWHPAKKSPGVSILEQLPKPYQESATRPWGSWYVLDMDRGYKVKRLEILVDSSISMQYHIHRSEHWTIVQGEGRVIVDGSIFSVKKGDSFFVPKQSIHKITNTSLKETLIAIEVQMGDICTEDDIVRV